MLGRTVLSSNCLIDEWNVLDYVQGGLLEAQWDSLAWLTQSSYTLALTTIVTIKDSGVLHKHCPPPPFLCNPGKSSLTRWPPWGRFLWALTGLCHLPQVVGSTVTMLAVNTCLSDLVKPIIKTALVWLMKSARPDIMRQGTVHLLRCLVLGSGKRPPGQWEMWPQDPVWVSSNWPVVAHHLSHCPGKCRDYKF